MEIQIPQIIYGVSGVFMDFDNLLISEIFFCFFQVSVSVIYIVEAVGCDIDSQIDLGGGEGDFPFF